MTDFQDINNLNPTPTALITGADKVPFYNTSDAKAYAMTMDQLQTWVLAGGTIDPTFDDVSADTVTITGTTGNTLVVDTNTLVVDATNNRVGVGTATPTYSMDVVGFGRFSSGILGAGGLIAYGDASSSSGLTLTSSGNLGLGVTPSATDTTGAFFIGGGREIIWASQTGYLSANARFFGGSDLYIANGSATRYLQTVGQHRWFTAPSGTAGNAITFTQAMTLDASGNLGLGVTPSAWASGWRVLEISSGFLGGASSYIELGQNVFYDGAFKYKTTAAATLYEQISGSHRWYNAPSGTAGNAITFTQAMTLDASGNLLVGTATTPSASSVRTVLSRAGSSYLQLTNTTSTGTGALVGIGSTGSIEFYTHTGTVGSEVYTQRWQVKSAGQTRFMPLAADPSGAEAGDVYYNSGTNKLKVYNGTAWVDLH